MVTIIISLLLVILFGSIIFVYNQLVKNRNRMQEAWSVIDVYLKKRHDLIPALVDAVKGYSSYEHNTLEEITQQRSEALRAQQPDAQIASESRLTTQLDRLLVVVEKYPELKANENFLNLQQQLSSMENDLEKARRYYNGTVRENNIALESFPTNIIGSLFNFQKGLFFQAETPEKSTPEISFP